jgi:hypothetical protein
MYVECTDRDLGHIWYIELSFFVLTCLFKNSLLTTCVGLLGREVCSSLSSVAMQNDRSTEKRKRAIMTGAGEERLHVRMYVDICIMLGEPCLRRSWIERNPRL